MDMMRTLARRVVESVWPSWKIVDWIGGGTYGAVYRAVNEKNDRLTSAIKIIPIPDESLAEELVQKRFLQRITTSLPSLRDYFRVLKTIIFRLRSTALI